MRLKALFFTFMALLLLIPYRAQSQITAPQVTVFEILDPDYRLQLPIWGQVEWMNFYGTSIKSVWADVDSVNTYLDGIEVLLKVSIDSFGVVTTADSLPVYVTVYSEGIFDLPAPFDPYLDSVIVNAESEVMNIDFPLPGMRTLMPDSAGVNPGDTLKVAYFKRSFKKHWERVLPIHPSDGIPDTILVGGAPIATAAVSNEYEFLKLRFLADVTSTDTTGQWALGYMVKNNGDPRWSGDGNDATVLKDSTFKYDDDFTPREGAPNVIYITHVNADSVYFIWYTASTTGRQILRWVEAWQSN